MQLSLRELAALVGGQFAEEPDPALAVRNFASIKDAEEGDVTFFSDARYLPALRNCRATVVLVPQDFREKVPPVCLQVEKPAAAFSMLVERFAPKPAPYAAGVHPTAVLGAGVEIGLGVSIQPYAVVEEGAWIGARSVIGAHGFVGRNAQVGEDCFLHPRVTVGERCILGQRVIIHSGTVLGSDGFGFEFQDGQHIKVPQVGIVQIGDAVEIGANCAIDRARFGRTWIQRGSKLDNLIQIGHNVVIGEHCIVVALTGISGSSRLGNYVIIGGQVGVAGHIEVGDHIVITAQSGVSKTLFKKGSYTGTPAVPSYEWRKGMARHLRQEQLLIRVKQLEQKLAAGENSSER